MRPRRRGGSPVPRAQGLLDALPGNVANSFVAAMRYRFVNAWPQHQYWQLSQRGALLSATSRNCELIVPDGTRYKLLGGHTSVELKAQMLCSASHLGNGEPELNLLPSWSRSHHHLALTDGHSRGADTTNSPNETAPPDDLALILPLEAILA